MKRDKISPKLSASRKSQNDFPGPKFNPGAIIDKPGNAREAKKVSFRNLRPVTDYSKCIKCGRCWTFCPDVAYEPNKDGTFKNLERYCKGCLICVNVCPVKCIRAEVVEQ